MFVIMLWKMAMTDVARFAALYTVVLVGHSIAFYAIEDPTLVAQYVYPGQELGSDFTWFKEFWWRLEIDFYVLLGQISWDGFESYTFDGYLWLADLLLLFHVIFCTIMLLNILIAMIGDTFGDVKENAFQEWTLTYAQIIQSIESEMTPHKLQKLNPYWTTIGGKRFIQLQETNRDFYKQGDKDTENLAELLKTLERDLDLNKDGKISSEELKLSELTRELGKIVEETPEDGFRAQKEHIAQLESLDNLGTTGNLTGRLNM